MSEDLELIQAFVSESLDLLDDAEPRLIALSEGKDGSVNIETVNSIFRPFHTMKGCAASMQLDALTRVAHESETVLDIFRKESVPFKIHYTDALCEAVDLLRKMLAQIHSTGRDDGFENEAQHLANALHKVIADVRGLSSDTASPVSALEKAPENAGGNGYKVDEQSTNSTKNISEKLLRNYISEGLELLEKVEEELSNLQSDLGNLELLNSAYRSIHSFKGNTGLLGLRDPEMLSHGVESILSWLRDNPKSITGDNIAVCLSTVDAIKSALESCTTSASVQINGSEVIMEILSDYLPKNNPTSSASAPASSDSATPPTKETPADPKYLDEPSSFSGDSEGSGPEEGPKELILIVEDTPFSLKVICNAVEALGYRIISAKDGIEALEVLDEHPDCSLCLTDLAMPRMDGMKLIDVLNIKMNNLPILVMTGNDDKEILKNLIGKEISGFLDKKFKPEELAEKIKEALKRGSKKKLLQSSSNDQKKEGLGRSDIRVDMAKLDQIMDLVGELIIAESMVSKSPDLEGLELDLFQKSSDQLHRIVSELHDLTLELRMVPVESLFKKMVRVIHDVSRKTGKKINLEQRGEDTELDKIVVDMLSDPLVHIMRNAADHGIETPEKRLSLGKPEAGCVQLSAEQRDNEVRIIIKDDGKGIDRQQILEVAQKRGFLKQSPEEMSDDDVYKLIFEPGFSTAEKVTDVSGRGVGMDVVRKNLDAIHGRIEILSELGKGSTFILKIPLTLATMEGMLIRVGTSLYTIPISCIQESLIVTPEAVHQRPDGREYLQLREDIIPVVRLYKIHHLVPDHTVLEEGVFIVAESDGQVMAIFADEVLYQLNTVIKDFSGFNHKSPTISGCNILGDGKISLILKIDSLLNSDISDR